MILSNIIVNTQSSIRIQGSKILYFDPYQIQDDAHDADFIFITHEHYDHFEPESIARLKKADTCLVAPESMKNKVLAKAGIASENCLFFGPRETHEKQGLLIETVPAYNKLKPFHMKGKSGDASHWRILYDGLETGGGVCGTDKAEERDPHALW